MWCPTDILWTLEGGTRFISQTAEQRKSKVEVKYKAHSGFTAKHYADQQCYQRYLYPPSAYMPNVANPVLKKRDTKDCPIIIRTLFLLSLFAVNFHAFNFEPGEVEGHF